MKITYSHEKKNNYEEKKKLWFNVFFLWLHIVSKILFYFISPFDWNCAAAIQVFHFYFCLRFILFIHNFFHLITHHCHRKKNKETKEKTILFILYVSLWLLFLLMCCLFRSIVFKLFWVHYINWQYWQYVCISLDYISFDFNYLIIFFSFLVHIH